MGNVHTGPGSLESSPWWVTAEHHYWGEPSHIAEALRLQTKVEALRRACGQGSRMDSMELLDLLRRGSRLPDLLSPTATQFPGAMVSPACLMEAPPPVWVTGGLTGTAQQW